MSHGVAAADVLATIGKSGKSECFRGMAPQASRPAKT